MDSKKGPPVGNLRPLTDAEWAEYQKASDYLKTPPEARLPREKLGADEIGCIHPLPEVK